MVQFNIARDMRKHSRIRARTVVLAILLMCSAAMATVAQPQLKLTRTIVSWPTVELHFKASCNSIPDYNLTEQYFTIHENGRVVPDFSLWCPDSTVRCTISVSIVLDASLPAAANAEARALGRAFIDQMDGQLDEAAIIYFNTQVIIAQQMSTLKPLLYAAVDTLPNSGSSAIWDGAYTGIGELINNGINQCRAMILVANGVDYSSTHSVSDVISLALRNRIRVFTIGVGDHIKEDELRLLAGKTGGAYMPNPNAGEISALYSDISSIINQSRGDCVITYQRDCTDGTQRQVELTMPQFCGGVVFDTVSYRAPLDSTTFRTARMTMPDMEAMSGDAFSIPVWIPIFPGIFPRFRTTLRFDERCLQFLSVETPPGTYLEGIPIDTQRVAGGVRLETLEDFPVRAYPFGGMLCMLNFRALNVPSKTDCSITASDASFAHGCLLPEIEAGSVTVYPATAEPVLRCDLSASAITVDEATDTYHPMPLTVECRVTNVGSVESAPVYATLSIQPDLAFDSTGGSGDSTLLFSPATIKSLETASVSWDLWHPVSRNERQYSVSVALHSANADSTTCTTQVIVPAVDLNPFSFVIDIEGGNVQYGWLVTLCPGDSVTLDAGPGYADYSWSTGATTRRIVVRDEGEYSCQVTDSTGWKGVSHIVRVQRTNLPFDKLSAWGNLPICSNDSIILSAGKGWPAYRWNTGDTTYRITVHRAGLYYAELTGNFGCIGSTDTIEVTTIPAPPKPMITRDLDALMSTEAHRYQWQLDGRDIPGATERTYRLTAPGSYRVQAFAENGCSEYSDPYDVRVLGVSEPAAAGAFSLHTWPDPVRSELHIALTGPPQESIRVLLTDVLGRTELLFDGQLALERRNLTREISDYAPGPLILLLLTRDGVQARKILKE